ncbi:hypothetical protein KJ596_00830, partial [Patescibacteria group bacterium]|nr:hypothetical protein [Patescibacteria group bacterium]MBU1867864.1 hypothetical protein [Patescibacteria group bacterium]
GKWSVYSILVFCLLLSVFYLFVALGQRGGDTFFSNLYLTIPMLCAGLAGILAFVTGIISIFKYRERSFTVFIATGIGLLVLLFILAEIAFPH